MKSGKKQLILLLSLFFLTIVIPLTVYLAQKQQIFKPKATGETVVRGQAGDLWADLVLGQVDFNQSMALEVTPFKVMNPGGVVVDRSVSPNRYFVYDGANSRVLGYKSLNNPCPNDSTKTCADIVLGQPSPYRYSGCNQDGNMENYPLRKPASASTLCTMPPIQISPGEGGSSASMAVDPEGNLYVPDFHNSRILKYNNPLTQDTVADEVWGQDDFSGFRCNKTDTDIISGPVPTPSASSLCFGRNSSGQESFQAGVDIDSSGNMWVADSSNNRVLRFPNVSGHIAKTADLVLGEPNFTTRNGGSGLNQMAKPAALRVSSDGNSLYVADLGNNRVLKFSAPFASNMAGVTFGSAFKSPSGIEFDTGGEGIWVLDSGNYMLELWNSEGTSVKKVLFKDTYQPNGQCGSTSEVTECRNPQAGGSCFSNMCGVSGSIGMESNGGILVSGSSFNQDAWHFSAPINPPKSGIFTSADKRLFSPPEGQNYRSNKGILSPRGIVKKNNQLIVSDGYKVVFWNNADSLSNGQGADGLIGGQSFEDLFYWLGGIAADNQNHLWVIRNAEVEVYSLPATHQETKIKTAVSYKNPLPVLGGGQLTWGNNDGITGIEIDPQGNLWLSQAVENPPLHRVFRVKDPFTHPLVDVVLGQATAGEVACNRFPGTDYVASYAHAGPNTVCFPRAVRVDKQGNVWVSDFDLEDKGNKRILEFNASLFNNITGQALFGPNASKIIPNVAAIDMGFDSSNRMVLGYNGYTNLFFPGFYNNPLSITTASAEGNVKDFFSQAGSIYFDDLDNLYIGDLNRGRVLIYKTPFIGSATSLPQTTLTPSPTPIPQLNHSPTPSPAPSDSTRPTPTPTTNPAVTPTPTPIPTPTPGPTSTPLPNRYDLNGDNVVNSVDVTILLNQWRIGRTSSQLGDLNGDRIINSFDYAQLIRNLRF